MSGDDEGEGDEVEEDEADDEDGGDEGDEDEADDEDGGDEGRAAIPGSLPAEVRDALALAPPRPPGAIRTLRRWLARRPAGAHRWEALFALLLLGLVAASAWSEMAVPLVGMFAGSLTEYLWDRRRLGRVARDGVRFLGTADAIGDHVDVVADGETLDLTLAGALPAGSSVAVLYLPAVRRCVVFGAESQVVALPRRKQRPETRLLDGGREDVPELAEEVWEALALPVPRRMAAVETLCRPVPHIGKARIRRIARDGVILEAAVVDAAKGIIRVEAPDQTFLARAPVVVRGADEVFVLYVPKLDRCLVYGARARCVRIRRAPAPPKARLLGR